MNYQKEYKKILIAVQKNCIECYAGNKTEAEKCDYKECKLFPYKLKNEPKTNRSRNATRNGMAPSKI